MDTTQSRFFVGIDVQISRPLAIAALDTDRQLVASFWAEAEGAPLAEAVLGGLEERGIARDSIVVGIDAPSRSLPKPRAFYWDAKRKDWRARNADERGWGRHAEVVISSCGLASPQWTPPAEESPTWMNVAFSLFASLRRRGIEAHEVFPSASYRQLAADGGLDLSINLAAFAPSPKDMLDACVAAVSVLEFEAGKGCKVGEDGLGSIVLPRPLPETTPATLLRWPEADGARQIDGTGAGQRAVAV